MHLNFGNEYFYVFITTFNVDSCIVTYWYTPQYYYDTSIFSVLYTSLHKIIFKYFLKLYNICIRNKSVKECRSQSVKMNVRKLTT